MKASIKFFAAVPCITAWLLACGSYSWKTAENTREEPKPASRLAAEFTNADFITSIMFEARGIVNSRYSKDTHPKWKESPRSVRRFTKSLRQKYA
jgi:hypothetical protein